MAFSRSGSVITQTGTDTDLSGITSALGASNIFSNGGAAPLNRTVYDLATPNYRLVVNGTLSFDPANEELWMPGVVNALDVGNSGNLTIGGTRTFGGGVSYSKEQAIFFDLRGSSHVAGNQSFMRVQSNGKFSWNGGVITNHAASDFLRDGTVNAGTLRLGTQLSSGTAQQYATFLQDITINDLLVDGLTRLVIRDANVQINGISLLHTAGLFADGNVAPNLNSYPPVEGYQAEFVEKDYTYWRGGKLRLRNSSVGSNAIANGNNVTSANSTGLLAIEQDFTLTVVDTLGNPITSGLWFIRDYDNGNRQNAGYTGGSGAANAAVNLLPDNTYNASFNAQGTHTPVTIVTAYGNRTSASSNEVGTYDTGPNRYDRRTKSDVQGGVNIDDMDVFVWSYLYIPTTLTPSLIGLGGTEVTTTLFDDNNITETNLATVNAYTIIETLPKLYDRAKAYKVVLANVEYPAADQQVATVTGADVDLGLIDLIVDATASSAFSINTGTNVLTIDAPSLSPAGQFSGVKTTGDVTFDNGADIGNGLRIEANDVFLNQAQDLTNVTIIGNLRINTGANSTLNFTNVTVTGQVFNDAAGNTLTINNSGGSLTAGDPGVGNGQTNIVSSVPVTITVLDVAGSPIQNARVFLETAGGVDTIFDGSDLTSLTDAQGEVSTTFGGATPVNVSGRARKSSSSPLFKSASISGTISGTGLASTVIMISDE